MNHIDAQLRYNNIDIYRRPSSLVQNLLRDRPDIFRGEKPHYWAYVGTPPYFAIDGSFSRDRPNTVTLAYELLDIGSPADAYFLEENIRKLGGEIISDSRVGFSVIVPIRTGDTAEISVLEGWPAGKRKRDVNGASTTGFSMTVGLEYFEREELVRQTVDLLAEMYTESGLNSLGYRQSGSLGYSPVVNTVIIGRDSPASQTQETQNLRRNISGKATHIADKIRGRIQQEIYVNKIPPVAALIREFKVAPNTIQQALSILKKEDLVYSRRGLGTFVNRVDETTLE